MALRMYDFCVEITTLSCSRRREGNANFNLPLGRTFAMFRRYRFDREKITALCWRDAEIDRQWNGYAR